MKASDHARHAALQRFERAAGEAFGWPETPVARARRTVVFAPAAIAAATAATAFAASLSYLV